MESAHRHQCLIYNGSPSRHFRTIAAIAREKLKENYRCLYLNNKPTVAGMRSYLIAEGVNVERETARGALILSSDRQHLVRGRFDIDAMLRGVETALNEALHDGYAGFWASGDMTWEFGPERDFSKLLKYERQLNDLLCDRPELSGICQYHAETLPLEVMHRGLLSHRSIFVNETLSLMNPHYVDSAPLPDREVPSLALNSLIAHLFELQPSC